jgi:hypothetical protein
MKKKNHYKYNQVDVLNFCNKKIKQLKKKKFNTGLSPFVYFTSWAQSPGYEIIKSKLKENNIFKRFYVNLKHKLFIFKLLKIKTFSLNNININDYNTIVLSWGSLKDFDNEGFYKDRYFNTRAKDNKNILWYIIYEGDLDIDINDKNVIVIYIDKNKKYINFSIFFKTLIKIIKISNYNILNFFHYFSFYSFYAVALKKILFQHNLSKINKIVMPYEGQPFQNYIYEEVSLNYQNIETIGINHSSLLPLPSNMFCRDGSPAKIIVNGSTQKSILENYLGWNTSNIFIKNSLRYKKDFKYNLNGGIFFPYYLSDIKIYIKIFENFLRLTDMKFGKLEIKIHPYMKYNKKNILLKNSFEKIIEQYSEKFDNNAVDDKVIILGSTTTVLLALELNIEVLHICAHDITEAFSNDIWDTIEVNEIYPKIYKYNLKNKNELIRLSNNDIFFNDYINL